MIRYIMKCMFMYSLMGSLNSMYNIVTDDVIFVLTYTICYLMLFYII